MYGTRRRRKKNENDMHYSYMAYQIHVTYSFAREKCSRADMCIAIVQPLIQDIALLRYEVMPGTIKRITDISGTLKAIMFREWLYFGRNKSGTYTVSKLCCQNQNFFEQFWYKWFSVNI